MKEKGMWTLEYNKAMNEKGLVCWHYNAGEAEPETNGWESIIHFDPSKVDEVNKFCALTDFLQHWFPTFDREQVKALSIVYFPEIEDFSKAIAVKAIEKQGGFDDLIIAES